MAYYKLFPEQDTTLYSHPNRNAMNTGNDEILEISKERGTTDEILYPTRILIKFNNEEIKDAVRDVIGHNNFGNSSTNVNLELFSAEHENLAKNLISTQNIVAYAVSESWDEGSGRYTNLPSSSNGATWLYRNNSTMATPWLTSSFSTVSTGSISASTFITGGGGTWYTAADFQGTQQFKPGDSLDVDMNITSIVRKWSESLFNDSTYSTGIENNGILLKLPESVEINTSHSQGNLQYFSTDTHTIYPPSLTFKWDDSTHTYQDSASLSGDLHVSLYRNQQEYNQNDTATFRIHVRDRYPTRQFASSSNFLNTGYFTTSSYYSIRDAHTEKEIVPFDNDFTKLSADESGMYFKVYMKGLQPERYYRVLFKNINSDGTIVYDNNYYFKVIR